MSTALAPSLFRMTDEVAAALREQRPVVALESTILSHGLPEGRRLTVAHALEDAVRREGAVPATIAIVDGQFCAGLDEHMLSRVAFDGAEKASLRDLAVALGLGGTWSTTVAATMAIAARAGIRVFATGGIGGVHREAQSTFDESADLAALAQYPVLVVCAGAKAVLDLPKTMERLETLGVPVIGYRTSELPAFYHGKSGLPLVCRIDGADEIARVMHAQLDRLSLGGLLVVQPPPAEFAQDPEVVRALITGALERARAAGVHGRSVTPFLLSALDQASGGEFVDTNIALVEENARLAARIAVADAARRR
ncbi:pseudouridine-5'-phosphate glycosidase [Myxococcota bacterium]|nr:pseudouridine-5'-phosphate glycosidase [Myxococcota bacterium]